MADQKISLRVSRILNLFLASLLLILVRVWYLSVVQREAYFQQSRKPQRRTVIEPIERATIRDRFNLPLAINQIQYNVAICYADIRQIPSVRWEKDPQDKSKKVSPRRQYIESLAKFLAKELQLNASTIEDTIHGKAALFPHTPFVIKEDIPETLYARLKILEKDWIGIQTQCVSRRVYPQGKCACDIVGYLGAINQSEYFKIAQEIQLLKNYLSEREEGKAVFLPRGYHSPFEVRRRLKELEERAYTINDLVGKSGVEAAFDQRLRGIYGKKCIEVDQKGNYLRELPGGRPGVNGERLMLSISVELQQTAEELLAEYELFQDKRDQAKANERRHPWIRGSSLVAMHPQTGEILAFASHPRFDPNDFVLANSLEYKAEKTSEIRRWLENPKHIAELWDGQCSLTRELFSPQKRLFYEEKRMLSWPLFIETILSKECSARRRVEAVSCVEEAIQIQEQRKEESLVIDLMSLIVRPEDLPSSLRQQVGHLKLADWRLYNQLACRYRDRVRTELRALFHELDFQKWRQTHFNSFLKGKRAQESKAHRYARPYTDYLLLEEQRQFHNFWEAHRLLFLHCFITGLSPSSSQLKPYLDKLKVLRATIADPSLEPLQDFLTQLPFSSQLHLLKAWRSFEELNHPLQGYYPMLNVKKEKQLERHLAAAFYPHNGYGYGRSQAFRQSTPLGSVFKLIPTYVALSKQLKEMKQELSSLIEWNPLTINDQSRSGNLSVLGQFSNGEPIPRYYKGGRLPRSSYSMGRINFMDAIECSSNLYFSLLAGDFLDNPMDLVQCASLFGLGEKTGIDLPGEYCGILPDDIGHNKTGLYSFAIGQHSLVVTPLQTAVMLSAIANGGKILKPQIVKLSAGKQQVHEDEGLFFQTDFPYQEPLSLVGISFPLFTQPLAKKIQGYVSYREPEVKRTVPMPQEVYNFLFEGMRRVTNGTKGSARPSIINSAYHDPLATQAYKKLYSEMIGKTGTAEIMYKQTIDSETPARLEKHVWFASISFTDSTLQEPELVVVVFLRFGESGREGAPLAARIIQKWREIHAHLKPVAIHCKTCPPLQ